MAIRELLQKHAVVAVVAICGGFLGSTARDWTKNAPATVQAERFEVIGPAGKILSYWGPDSDPQIPASTPKCVLLVFVDVDGVRRRQVGSRIGDYGPELLFYGKDGPSETRLQKHAPRPRFSVSLGYNDDPVLAMLGQSTEQVILGAMHGDAPDPSDDEWGLSLRAREARAGANIGFLRWWDGSYHASVKVRTCCAPKRGASRRSWNGGRSRSTAFSGIHADEDGLMLTRFRG